MDDSNCSSSIDGLLQNSPQGSLQIHNFLRQHPATTNLKLSRTKNDILTVIVKKNQNVTGTDCTPGVSFETNCCPTLSSITSEDNAPEFNTESAYATLTPLQSLPPISTMSEKFIFGGHINGNCIIDNEIRNDSNNENVQNSSLTDSAVRENSYEVMKTICQNQSDTQQQTVQNYNYQRHQNSVNFNELVESSFCEPEKTSSPPQNQTCIQPPIMSSVLNSFHLNGSMVSESCVRKSYISNFTLSPQMRQIVCMTSSNSNADIIENDSIIHDLEATFNDQKCEDLANSIHSQTTIEYSPHQQADSKGRTLITPNSPNSSYSNFLRDTILPTQKIEGIPSTTIDNSPAMVQAPMTEPYVIASSTIPNINIAQVSCPFRKQGLRKTYKNQMHSNFFPITSECSKNETNKECWAQKQLRPDEKCDTTASNKEMEEINTKDLAQRISSELKRYSIPQAIFAQRVLCRSQGTLSDLLRNPKPWSKLKSGRETFRRMLKWLQEPEFQRMSALRNAAAQTPQRSGSVVNTKLGSNDCCAFSPKKVQHNSQSHGDREHNQPKWLKQCETL